jgi:hypothetical protein
VLVAVSLCGTSTASAHLVSRPKSNQLNEILRSQQANLAHARFVCRHGGGQHKRWACHARVWLRREIGETRHALFMRSVRANPRAAICYVFGSRCSEALRVADCETGGTFWVGARNGQYLGLFQMGKSERATYGHGSSAIEQARAAYRYFIASGSDWSPWECKP